MRAARARVALLAVVVIGALGLLMMVAMGNPNGNPEQNWTLCGHTENCHGVFGLNNSSATVTVETPTTTVYAGQPDIPLTVRVTGAEQTTDEPIGVFLFSSPNNPTTFALPTHPRNGWGIMRGPNGQTPGFNYAQKPAQGPTEDSNAEFTWLLRAPPIPGNYSLTVRMHTGWNVTGAEPDTNPVSRDLPNVVTFRVVAAPRVVETFPEDGTQGVYVNRPVVIVFNKEMDRPTVEAAFSIDPPVAGTFAWEGAVMRYVVDGYLTEGENYTVRLTTTARDIDGIGLLEPHEFSFATGTGVDVFAPTVLGVVASRAPLDAVVRIEFDEPMDRASVESAFSITPSLAGALSWERYTLVFTPADPLDYDTYYTVTINTTARDLAGNALLSQIVMAFRTIPDTEPPAVLRTDPAAGATDLPLNASLRLELSPDVNASTLAAALSTSPPVLWNVTWDGPNATLRPMHALEPGTDYVLTVGTALMDVRGNPLAAPFELRFRTEGSSDRTPPTLLKAYPAPGGRISLDGTVTLTWSEPMDHASVEAALLVSPAADASVSWSGDELRVALSGLEEGRVYTINVGPSAADAAGNPTGEPYALRYLAAPPPVAREPFFYVEDWVETWWDLALVVVVVAMGVLVAAVQMRVGWRRVALTAFAWVEERVRTARYLGQARRLYYSINRQLPQSHAERYGSKIVWYWYPFYCLGGIAALSFLVCGVTGIILALYYVPSAEGDPSAAYRSVEHIMQNVSFGFMFRAIHHWSANVMIAAVFLHMLRVYFTGAYRNPRELNWVVGVVLMGLTLLYGFSGYLLPWNQLSYWAGTIGLEMARTVPLMGDWFAGLIFGGLELGAATLTRMYFLHVVLLPAFTIGLVMVHLVAVYIQGIAEPH